MSGLAGVPTSTVVVPMPAARGVEPPTMARLVGTLGSHALSLVTDAGRLQNEIGEPVVHGPGEPIAAVPAGLLLLTGSSPGSVDALDAVHTAGTRGYVAVVVKAFGDDLTALTTAARHAGLALLTTPDEMAWRHLDALITATRSAGVGSDIDHLASVGLGDLFALANAIASSAGGAVTIEEPTGRVLAYSNLPHHEIDEIRRAGILGRQTPERPTNQTEYQAVLSADGPVRFASQTADYASRMAVAVRAGAQALGVIWILTDRPPLVAGAEIVLANAAKATALHLLRARGQRDPERAHRTGTLRLLLDGAINPRAAATQLGLRGDTPTFVLAVAPVGAQPEPLVTAARSVDLVTLYCESWHSSALCVADAGVVYALLPADAVGEPPARLMRLAQDLASSIQRSAQLDVLVAVSSVAEILADVPAARQGADRVLEVLAEFAVTGIAEPRVASVEQVSGEVVLRALGEQGAASHDMLLPSVRSMVAHDAEHRTSYAKSMVAYLGAFGDVVRAAAMLGIHENTLRYRVRRAQALFSLDLEDADRLLAIWLQLRLLQLSHRR